MMKDPDRVKALERDYNRRTYGSMEYREKLRRYEAMWMHAVSLDPEFGKHWQEDIQADITLARILNGLPPQA
jgi:hypothetical protein